MKERPRTCNHDCRQSDRCPSRTGVAFKDGMGCAVRTVQAFQHVTGESKKSVPAQATQAQAATENVADDNCAPLRVAIVGVISLISFCILLAKAAGVI